MQRTAMEDRGRAFPEAAWFKASGSCDTGNCFEVNIVETVVGVRDSKEAGDPNRQVLVFNRPDFRAFVDFVVAEATATTP